jgi:hypothetical protein
MVSLTALIRKVVVVVVEIVAVVVDVVLRLAAVVVVEIHASTTVVPVFVTEATRSDKTRAIVICGPRSSSERCGLEPEMLSLLFCRVIIIVVKASRIFSVSATMRWCVCKP